nr:hypothetical protein GCM10020092_098290 [Actinoplanes digitatis]
MRQRLSSEPDRYRGRRRVPTPPRSRYAVVVTSAFVGAGVVALGAASQLPDAKTINPSVLQNLEAGDALADRSADGDRASRGEDRTASTKISDEQAEAEAWLLPLDDYQFTLALRGPLRQAARRRSTWRRPRAPPTRPCTPAR